MVYLGSCDALGRSGNPGNRCTQYGQSGLCTAVHRGRQRTQQSLQNHWVTFQWPLKSLLQSMFINLQIYFQLEYALRILITVTSEFKLEQRLTYSIQKLSGFYNMHIHFLTIC